MSVLQKERDLKAKLQIAADAARGYMQAAEAENRELTKEERAEIDTKLAEAKDIKLKIDAMGADRDIRDQIAALSGAAAPVATQPRVTIPKSFGQQFVEAEGMMDFFKSGAHRTGSTWRSPAAELQAATLTTDSASGGDLIVSDYRPGILPLLFKRLTVADLLAPGTTDSSSVTYMKETTFTNAAAAVAEGGTKPESTLIFDQVTDLVKKIAHWLPVTDEMLEDVSQIRSYIDARLRLGLDLTEEDQLLNGSGSGANITGLLNRSGLASDQARSSDTNEDAIFKQIWAIFTNSYLMPDGVIVNPTNWQTIALRKDTTGQYIFSSPASGGMTPQRLWGLPVVVTPSIVANTGLVGAYKQGAQVFRKGGVRVEASNSHADFFVKNLTAIRAEERLALAVYRPASIGKVTGLN